MEGFEYRVVYWDDDMAQTRVIAMFESEELAQKFVDAFPQSFSSHLALQEARIVWEWDNLAVGDNYPDWK